VEGSLNEVLAALRRLESDTKMLKLQKHKPTGDGENMAADQLAQIFEAIAQS
jgi:hypothetical protein